MHFATAVLFALQSATANPPPAAPAPPPPACATEAHSAFDFWVGEWEVFPTGSDNKAAESLIERLSSGCVIRETWMPLRGGGGTSLTMINHSSGRWEQLWIGSDGRRVDFSGGVVDGNMVLSGYWDGIGPDGSALLIRMTFSKNEDGSVRQFGEASTDHGKTWQSSFDLTYRRKSGG